MIETGRVRLRGVSRSFRIIREPSVSATQSGTAMTSIVPAVNACPAMLESGTISRGKLTFFTRLALSTRLDAADCAPPRKSVHTVSPVNRKSA